MFTAGCMTVTVQGSKSPSSGRVQASANAVLSRNADISRLINRSIITMYNIHVVPDRSVKEMNATK